MAGIAGGNQRRLGFRLGTDAVCRGIGTVAAESDLIGSAINIAGGALQDAFGDPTGGGRDGYQIDWPVVIAAAATAISMQATRSMSRQRLARLPM